VGDEGAAEKGEREAAPTLPGNLDQTCAGEDYSRDAVMQALAADPDPAAVGVISEQSLCHSTIPLCGCAHNSARRCGLLSTSKVMIRIKTG
jgi:hypothetical protein